MVTCPTCRTTTLWHGNVNRPFCSLTCRLIDLGTWRDERYSIPAGRHPDEAWVAVEDDVP